MIHLNFFKANPHGHHLGHIIDAGRLAHSPIEFDNVNLIDESHVHHHLNSTHLQDAGRLAHSPIEFDNVNLIDESHVHHHLNSTHLQGTHLQGAHAHDVSHVL